MLNKKAHTRVDLISARYSPRVAIIIELLTCFLGLAFLSVLFYRGTIRTISAIQINEHSTSVWGPTLIPYRMALPIGTLFFLLQYLSNLIQNVLILIKGADKIGS